eukprot:13464163-Ditylum_brightwellii.AAC.1
MSGEYGCMFISPVNSIALGLSDYFQKIKRLMELGTFGKHLENDYYAIRLRILRLMYILHGILQCFTNQKVFDFGV